MLDNVLNQINMYRVEEVRFAVTATSVTKGESVRVEEGDCIPSLVVTYYPK